MALGWTLPLREIRTGNFPRMRVKGGRRVGLTTLLPSLSRFSRQNIGASTSQTHGPVTGTALPFFFLLFRIEIELFPSVGPC
jgi:hypothetical protein